MQNLYEFIQQTCWLNGETLRLTWNQLCFVDTRYDSNEEKLAVLEKVLLPVLSITKEEFRNAFNRFTA